MNAAGQVERDLALAMALAEDAGYGTIPVNEEAAALYGAWVDRGWAESYVDDDGETVFLLTDAGEAALITTK